LSPAAVDACSLWQFAAAVDGWNRVHGAEPKLEPPSDAEFDAMIDASAELEAKHYGNEQERRGIPPAVG
jgi:hypothetical protein